MIVISKLLETGFLVCTTLQQTWFWCRYIVESNVAFDALMKLSLGKLHTYVRHNMCSKKNLFPTPFFQSTAGLA